MKLSNSKIFLFCCISFIIGVGIASFLSVRFLVYDILFFFIIMFCLVLIAWFWQDKNLRLIFLIGLFLFLGVWRYSLSLPVTGEDKIWFYNGNTVELVGIIREIDLSAKGQKIILNSFGVNKKFVQGKLLIQTDRYPEFKYGEELKLTCELQKPERLDDFAYDRYLAKSEIYSLCYYPSNIERREFKGNYFYNILLKIKSSFQDKINQGSREPYSSLITALVLGNKDGIPLELQTLFSRVGVSHMIAISGMHIGILVMILMWSLIYLGLNRKQAFYLIIIFLFVYLAVIGFPASAVRASLMGFLILWAMYLGRLNRILNSLTLVASIILLFNPKLLRNDIGFQLSFLAVLGIVILYSRLQNYFVRKKILDFWHLNDLLAISLSAQIFTLPIVAYNFSQISLIAPITNLLVIWALPFLLGLSILAILLSFVFPPLAFVFFLPAELILAYILQVCEILVKIPLSYIQF